MLQIKVCNRWSFSNKSQDGDNNINLGKYFNCIIKLFYIKVKIKPFSTVDVGEQIDIPDNILSINHENNFKEESHKKSNEIVLPPISVSQKDKLSVKNLDGCIGGYSQKKIDKHVQNKKIEYLIRSINTDPEFIKTIINVILQAKLDIDECTFLESRQIHFQE